MTKYHGSTVGKLHRGTITLTIIWRADKKMDIYIKDKMIVAEMKVQGSAASKLINNAKHFGGCKEEEKHFNFPFISV
jgi:hypothetical protein